MKLCPHCHSLLELAPTATGSDRVEAESCGHVRALGTTLAGRWRLDAIVSVDAISALYDGTDTERDVGVLIALLDPVLGPVELGAVAELQRRGRQTAELRHPHLARILRAEVDDSGRCYSVMERAPGRPLSALLGDAPLSVERVDAIARQIYQGLAAAHAHGVIHGNLSPWQIWVAEPEASRVGASARDEITLVGMGFASSLALGRTDGGTFGAARYAAPEQVAGGRAEGPSDLYSAAVILYELLTGEAPFEGRFTVDYLLAHLRETPARPRVKGRALEGGLVDSIMASLNKAPADRPGSAQLAARWRGAPRIEAQPDPTQQTRELAAIAVTEDVEGSARGKPWQNPLPATRPRRGQRPTRMGLRIRTATATG